MKKFICLTLIFLFVISFSTFADNGWNCYYPEDLDIKSTEFSTGGGEKTVIYLEVFGWHKEQDQYVTYIDSKVSASGFLGLGRFTMPSKINYIPWDKDRIKLTK